MSKAIRYGLFTAAGLIIYFVFMKFIGQERNLYLRFFNGIILIVGVYLLLKNEFQKVENERPSYLEGLANGMILTVTSVFAFIAFLAIYVSYFDSAFIEVLEDSKIWGSNLTLSEASFAIFAEGMASGAIISFGWMQFFKVRIAPGK